MADRTTAGSQGKAGGDKSQGSGGESLGDPGVRGRTTIADSVAEKIVGVVTRDVPGVHSLGSGMARTMGGMRDRVAGGRPSVTRGVQVEVGEKQAAVDLDVVVDYGAPIPDVVADVRTSVISAMDRMTGLEVVEVNVTVDDVDLPGDDENDDDKSDDRVS
ncbi:Asp23/Gls24 family envelope stress response protein [Streptomyces fuscigenes]|uniref:Asp23/Gls24 family envelope stress response protein n=1 Tax=Streptomyces fuscigenes TaxID=1528880 RepID=UPI001F3244D3|nr:Asp23/Gls24 family envelope stress response protein [Streptomyces fuscigenes]MCF3962118.1 Asp23/Gls24 family envelope stress response protein [Streptomyces fuscigenes]